VILTVRETQVIELVALGLSNGEIGFRLGVTDDTIKKHVGSLMAKTGTVSRQGAAIALGYLTLTFPEHVHVFICGCGEAAP
jgi:DNA-binding NarL/FixJ family response regulator